MINIEILANDNESKKEHSLKIEIYNDFIQFLFNNRLSTIDIDTVKVDKLLIDYVQNYANGQPIQDREIFKKLQLNVRPKIDIDLARIFFITNAHSHFAAIQDYDNPEIYYKYIEDRNNSFLNDFNILEWDGTIGPQPGIYFIRREYLEIFPRELTKFYSLGWLYKYKIIINENKTINNYVFPFSSVNIKNYEVLFYRNVWNKIIKDRNEELLKFINGQRGNK